MPRLSRHVAAWFLLAAAPASAQLRVTTWNVTNYSSGRTTEIQTVVYGVFGGRSMSPDVIIGQEFINATSVTNFRTILNSAPGSPGDWNAAAFSLDGGDTSNGFFYRTSKVTFLSKTLVHNGGTSPSHPRAIQRFDILLHGYTSESATLACYSTHMKAQDTGSDDDARRLLEAQRVRTNAQTLPAERMFLFAGDTNIQSSTSPEYQALVASQADNTGRFFDPINRPGTWNNGMSFRFIHTQDPVSSGGMDDRHDQILVCNALLNGSGFRYIGNPAIPYSDTTWNDPNHSYRAWGNDGTSFNAQLTVTNNQMVGPTIAQAIKDSTGNAAGHIPVFLDLRAPPKISADAALDFGTVAPGAVVQRTLMVANSADLALWSAAGVTDLSYSLSVPASFNVPAGTFVDAVGGGANAHLITFTAGTPGIVNATLQIASNAADTPSVSVALTAIVIAPPVKGDFNANGIVDTADVAPFVQVLLGLDASTAHVNTADMNSDGTANGADIQLFVAAIH